MLNKVSSFGSVMLLSLNAYVSFSKITDLSEREHIRVSTYDDFGDKMYTQKNVFAHLAIT